MRLRSLALGLPVAIAAISASFALWPKPVSSDTSPLLVGAAAVDVTPQFEGRPLPTNGDPMYHRGDPFYDSGIDGLFDSQEPGYSAQNPDPDGDDYDPVKNPKGTEGDHKFEGILLGGFGPYYPYFLPNRYAAGVHDPIWARALALRGSNGQPLILMAVDNPGLAWKHINPVRRRLERELGIPRDNIIIACTHDHAAPDGSGLWTTALKGHEGDYAMKLREWMYQAAVKAVAAMEPAVMKTVTTTHYSCIDAATGELKKDPDCHIPDQRNEYDGPDGAKFDPFLIQQDKRDPIVRNTRIVAAQFLSVKTGATIGTFVDWNNHPDSLTSDNMYISSDYAHYLRERVERELGGIAVYFTGTLGRQIGSSPGTPAPLWDESGNRVQGADGKPVLVYDGWERIRSIGYEVGHEAAVALQAASAADEIPIQVKTESIDIPVDNALHLLLARSAWQTELEPQDQLKHHRGCRGILALGCVREPLSVLEIGDLGLVTIPGEVDPAYFLGRHASHADYGKFGTWDFPAMVGWEPFMPGKHKAVIGQANGYLSYLIHKPDNVGWWNFAHPNHYEEFVTVGKWFGDDVGNKMMEMLGSPVRFSDRPVPETVPGD